MRAAAATVVGTAVIGTTLSVVGGSAAQADQITQGVDNLRTNWDAGESGLSPAVVQSSAFGQLFATQLDGQIYAQPLTVGDEVIAVTENNTAYGLDRRTGHIDWQQNFGPAFPAAAIGCGDLTPSIGASATPVYDPATNAVYFTTKVDDGTATHRHPTWLMHAVDPSTGTERDGWPVTISGKPGNAANITFDPYYEQQRPGLLLMDGVVYAGFGAHCDVVPYRGYVVGVGVAEHKVTSMWASETGDSVAGAGVWQSGGGLVSDGPGRIFFSTGNGISPAPGPGTTVQGSLAESVVRLQVNADKSLSTADFFSPSNAASLDLQDQDISSGAPMALPDGFGTAAHPHLMVQQGKDGRVFLLDRDNLGGMSQAPGGGNAVVSTSGPYQGLWGHPAFWGGDGGYVYLVGNNGPLRALAYGVNNGNPALTFTGHSQDSFGYTSGSPLVTSNGTDDSTGLIWVVSANDASGAGGTLRAYSPVPDGDGLLQLLWSAPVGTATKFSTPTADKGVVYVGTRDGFLYGFGSPATTALTAAPVDFGQVGVGASGTGTMTLTATKDLAITGLTASGAFAVTADSLPSAGQPTQLASGATLDVPLSFTPTTTGGISGMLTANLSDGEKLVFALHGVGTRPGLGAAPSLLDFDEVPTGSVKTLNLQITNTGTDAETVDSVTAPAGAFSATGLPAAGTVVPAGGSFVATVAYAPVAGSKSDSDALVVNSSSAGQSHALKVPVGGSAVTGQGHLEFSPSSLDFGKVPIGSSKTLTFTINNTGNLPVTVTKAKAPAGDFGSAVQLSEGLVIGPEQSTVQSVTFTPRSTTAQSGAFYEVTGDAGQGAQFVPVSGTGTGTPATTTVADGSWHANGTAAVSDDGSVQLTPASPGNQAGSVVYTKPLPTDGLRATFTAKFGPGTGGYGIAYALLDPAQNTGSALGGSGTGLGIAGQQGVVVALGTGWSAATGMQNYVAVGTSTAGSPNITYTSKASLATALRQGTHQVDIESTGGHLYVRIDGTQVMDSTQALPPTALVALSAGTGVNSDAHKVSGVVVSDVPPTTPPTAAAPPFLARDTTGTLWQYRTTGSAAAPFQARQKVGGGWQIYNALISLSTRTATAHADLVARDTSGVLWYYAGTGNTTTPLAPRVRVGAGWGIYGTMTGVGDVTGDGRTDLVARDAGGVLWLYRGTGSASAPFAARTRVGAGWGVYGTMTGVGDVTGDGKADLVARDATGVLWLYRGTGSASAPFAARTRVGAGWNIYGMLTAVGDVTGDGKADLVARDATGVLWLYRGTGSASAPFAARSRIGSGWNTYNTLV